MKKTSTPYRLTAALLLLLLTLAIPVAVSAVTWPIYENGTRHMGTVSELYHTVIGGQAWVAFVLSLPDGSVVRYDCDTRAHTLACDQVAIGDKVLVSGHSESYGGARSCRWDGGDYLLVPNVLWKCNMGPCVQLTQ